MSWLNNFKITYKIGLIVAMLMIGVAACRHQDEGHNANFDIVTRVDKYTALRPRRSLRKPHLGRFNWRGNHRCRQCQIPGVDRGKPQAV
jgi:hypothetical protein